MTTISKELMRHAQGLIKRRWGQGDDNVLGPDPACCCVATACVAASHKLHPKEQADSVSRDAVLVFKRANGIPDNMSVGDWNDAPGRTKADVLAAFDKAIEASASQVQVGKRIRKGPRPAMVAP